MRIVSLLPSATEWVCALGMQDELVGVSHECDFPTGVQGRPKVTRSRIDASQSCSEIDQVVQQHSDQRESLYDFDEQLLCDLKPDLIISQTLCNVCAVNESDIRRCVERSMPDCSTLDLSADTFDGVLNDATKIIQATGNRRAALEAFGKIEDRIASLRRNADGDPIPKVTLLEWSDPLYSAGHWTPQLIDWAGGVDPIGTAGVPSRRIEMSQLVQADPDMLLIACCGLSQQRGQEELTSLKTNGQFASLRCVLENEIHVFDGSAYFNRPGPRLVDALDQVGQLVKHWRLKNPS